VEYQSRLRQYVHLPQGEDIGPAGRSYQVQEKVLQHNGREILYLVTEACAVFCCDRSYNCQIGAVNVKGYIVRWKHKTNEKGEPISEVEPIEDEKVQQEIREILRKEQVWSVYFG